MGILERARSERIMKLFNFFIALILVPILVVTSSPLPVAGYSGGFSGYEPQLASHDLFARQALALPVESAKVRREEVNELQQEVAANLERRFARVRNKIEDHPRDRWNTTPLYLSIEGRESTLMKRWQYSLSRAKSWSDMVYGDWTVLRTVFDYAIWFQEQQNWEMTLISNVMLEAALNRPDGIQEVARRLHPYTIQALIEKNDFFSHAAMHQFQYYDLYAWKLLREAGATLPPDTAPRRTATECLLGLPARSGPVVLLFDPHSDAVIVDDEGRPTNLDEHTGVVQTHGVTDATWAAAAVRDDLAAEVVVVFTEAPGGLQCLVITKNQKGDVIQSVRYPFETLAEQWRPGSDFIVSIDQDSFSLKNSWHVDDRETILVILTYWYELLRQHGWVPRKITTADSEAYQDPTKSDAAYRLRLRIYIEAAMSLLAPGSSMHMEEMLSAKWLGQRQAVWIASSLATDNGYLIGKGTALRWIMDLSLSPVCFWLGMTEVLQRQAETALKPPRETAHLLWKAVEHFRRTRPVIPSRMIGHAA